MKTFLAICLLFVTVLFAPLAAFADGLPILDKISNLIPEAGTAVLAVAAVVEFVLRIIKSKKPLSILYLVANICKQLGTLFSKLGDFLNKVIPQRVQ